MGRGFFHSKTMKKCETLTGTHWSNLGVCESCCDHRRKHSDHLRNHRGPPWKILYFFFFFEMPIACKNQLKMTENWMENEMKIDQNSIENWSKIESKSMKNSLKIRSKIEPKLIKNRTEFEMKIASKSIRNRSEIDSKSIQKSKGTWNENRFKNRFEIDENSIKTWSKIG